MNAADATLPFQDLMLEAGRAYELAVLPELEQYTLGSLIRTLQEAGDWTRQQSRKALALVIQARHLSAAVRDAIPDWIPFQWKDNPEWHADTSSEAQKRRNEKSVKVRRYRARERNDRIMELHAEGMKQVDIAAETGCCQATVSRVIRTRRDGWKRPAQPLSPRKPNIPLPMECRKPLPRPNMPDPSESWFDGVGRVMRAWLCLDQVRRADDRQVLEGLLWVNDRHPRPRKPPDLASAGRRLLKYRQDLSGKRNGWTARACERRDHGLTAERSGFRSGTVPRNPSDGNPRAKI